MLPDSSPCLRLAGPWQVCPVPLEDSPALPAFDPAAAFAVPECAHLQPVLCPDDPFWHPDLRGINTRAWLYRQTFSAPPGGYRRARLGFGGVDYFADVWLNGRFLGRHEGNFAPFAFDVTEALLPGGENDLLVRVASPWDAPSPGGSYPTDHVLRGLVKGLYEHGEGVIPPDVNPLGIWRPVHLLLDDGLSLDQVRIRTRTDGSVELRLTATNATAEPVSGALALTISGATHDGPGAAVELPLNLPPGVHAVEHTLHLPDPRLWWPWDHGRADLYRLDAVLRAGQGRILSALGQTFGLREVRLDRSPDRFTFVINGRALAVRGTAYIPALYLSQATPESLERDLAFAREANLNLLRVHVHVSPPELYALCDRAGLLIWQDFELNWMHDPSPQFEARALVLQRQMIDLLGNHPSVITWSCHNEPTMILARRQNLERHPDPALYTDACQYDPTRPVFLCSGQMEADWQRSGDAHTYYGALWTRRYSDVYRHHFKLNTEFGFEAPAAPETLRQFPRAWEGLKHLEFVTGALWDYQAKLVQFHVEHLRRLRAAGCAGYVHFWLADLAPQVGCGVLDSARLPKGGYDALRQASQPLLVALEHDGRGPKALWVFNDTLRAYPGAVVSWRLSDPANDLVLEGSALFDIAPNGAQRLMAVNRWPLPPRQCLVVALALHSAAGDLLAENRYDCPFDPPSRPRGYPWTFDPALGCKVFEKPGAPSLAAQSSSRLFRLVPLAVRERAAEFIMRQRWPLWLARLIGRVGDGIL